MKFLVALLREGPEKATVRLLLVRHYIRHILVGERAGELGNVESVEYEHVLVVLGQRYNVAFRRDLQTTATAHLQMMHRIGK